MSLKISEDQIKNWVKSNKINKLIDALNSVGSDEETAKKISAALIGLGKPVVDPFLKACGSKKSIGIRIRNRYEILAEIYKASQDDDIFKKLLKALKPTSTCWVEGAAAEEPLLAGMVDQLRRFKISIPDEHVTALGRIKSEKAIPQLMKVLVTPDNDKDHIEEKVIEALVSIGGPSIAPLWEGMKDPRPSYREACLGALKELKSKMTKAQLVDFERIYNSNKIDIRRGGFNEPYCSANCYKRAAEQILAITAAKPPAQCRYCGRSFGKLEYADNTFGFIPYENKIFSCAVHAQKKLQTI
jgi:hypothetical protein